MDARTAIPAPPHHAQRRFKKTRVEIKVQKLDPLNHGSSGQAKRSKRM
jgi:hypothetical protein